MTLTPEIRAKRVAIAQDVLDRLDGGKLDLMAGNYMAGELIGVLPDPDDDLKAHVDLVEESCQVCQLGALLLSKARLYDAVPVTTVVTFADDFDPDAELIDGDIDVEREDVIHALEDVFDHEVLDRLEVAFEGVGFHGEPDTSVIAFTRGLGSACRVRKCMTYLIEHDGDFDP